ncbi:MAG: tetratricopeptide repeat protein [Puniceicoccaceae bacterium]
MKTGNYWMVKFVLMVGAILVAGSGVTSAEPAAERLLEAGLYHEEVRGDLNAAIEVYEQISREYPGDRAVAAQALLHAGLCYERLGKHEAQAAFRRLIEEYGDQSATVKVARQHLERLGNGGQAISVRQAWSPGEDAYATSPDGRFITYIDWSKGNLAIHNLETGENRYLTDSGTWEGDYQFSDNSIWSPDSKLVAYAWFTRNVSDLRIVGIDGSEPTILIPADPTQAHGPIPLDWSKDGKYILAALGGELDESLDRGHTDELILISVADGSYRSIKHIGDQAYNYWDLSPDGKYVVYDKGSTQDANDRDIYVLAIDGSLDARIIDHPEDDYAPFWTPDNKHIVFVSTRSGTASMWMLEIDNGKPTGIPTIVKEMGSKVKGLGFSNDGTFYYSTKKPASDVYLADVDSETGQFISPGQKVSLKYEGYNYSPIWSPDGMNLAYISERRYHGTMVLHAIDTGDETRLDIQRRQSMIPHTRCNSVWLWAHDGKSILSTGKDRSKPAGSREQGVYRFILEDGTLEQIPIKHPAESFGEPDVPRWPVCSPDGRMLYYTLGRMVMSLDMESRRERLLHKDDRYISKLGISPDGRDLVYLAAQVELNLSVVMTIPAAGGEARELLSLDDGQRLSACVGIWWSNDGKRVFVGGPPVNREPNKLWSIQFSDGEVTELPNTIPMHQLAVHPDGNRIAYSSPESDNWIEVWAMSNFLP